jgi:glycosyltransferase involved in cell wall biosynthesis
MDMKNLKFSIIMAVYNASRTVEQAVTSALQQTYTDFEIILINDGSQDDSGDICRELQRLDNRIHYIEFPRNLGLSQVRNHGIQMASGQYIGFLDADDTLESNALAVCYDRLKKQSVDILVFGLFEDYDTVNKKGSYELSKIPGDGYYVGHEEICSASIELIRSSSFCYACNKLYRRRFLIEYAITFLDYPYVEDIIMNLTAFAKGASVLVIDVPLYHYHKIVQSSITAKYEANYLPLHQHLMDLEVEYFSDNHRLELALPIISCQYLKLMFTALQMTFYKEALPNSLKTLLASIYRYPRHKQFMFNSGYLPFRYKVLRCILMSQSTVIIGTVSYLIYIMKHKLIRLWCIVK